MGITSHAALRTLAIVFLTLQMAGAQAPPQVAPTEPLSPREQQTMFVLPKGFEIQLVLSEPDIGQPMNLNFDARGRLWVSHSIEYPYPAKGEGVEPRGRFAGMGDHPPRDRLTVVESLGPDGRAQTVRHFVEGLNIPIGHVPMGNGSTTLAYSIPAIARYRDTDGDGKADERKELYGRFGNVDTHGMASSFTPWIDGWIYGCHGFANHSLIQDASGNKTEMTSGNTYRFRADGSRFEQFTYGQVNPFGMAFDALGNLYDADCHSMPVYLLLRGATYPHFGSVAGPLGFGPKMINHNHGSTGICGVSVYDAEQFPEDYRNSLFICNPVTGRVHHDKLKAFGSTYQADTQPDFIQCKDPWFRPVDSALGPDGALYIADFYNAIIGHYEVPLEHPKRDRQRGRVWRIVYRGPDGKKSPTPTPDLTKLSTTELIAQLANSNLLVRTLATNLLVEVHSPTAAGLVREAMQSHSSPELRAHGLWVIERLEGLRDAELEILAKDTDRLVRVHLMKALAERKEWNAGEFALVRSGLSDADAFVRRAAADALGRHPHPENGKPLLACWNEAGTADSHLIHTIKLALRSHFDSEAAEDFLIKAYSAAEMKHLLEIAPGSSSVWAAEFQLRHAQWKTWDQATWNNVVLQIARNGRPEQIARLIEILRQAYASDPVKQFGLFSGVAQGLNQRGMRPEQDPAIRGWLEDLMPALLDQLTKPRKEWQHVQLPELPKSPSPWGVRERKWTNGQTHAMIDSISHGETLTGLYRSPAFAVPERLSFWMCGHNGFPNTDPPPVNHVRLRLLETDEIIAKDIPPRNDTARKYTWDLKQHAGKQAVFEIIDACTLKAYAWIAVGGFEPALIPIPSDQGGLDADGVFATISRFQLKTYAPRLIALARDENHPLKLRSLAAAHAVELGASEAVLPVVRSMLAHPDLSPSDCGPLYDVLGRLANEEARGLLMEALTEAPAALQREIALALCQSTAGAWDLLTAIQKGKASARLLQNPELKAPFDQHVSPMAKETAAALLKEIPSVEQHLVQLIAERRATYRGSQASAERGKAVFMKNCAACHKVGDEGQLIGPQLDGIGLRGMDRLLEDVLDPNRNVDAAFRTQTILTTDGRVLTGIRQRQEGQVLVIADQKGKEISIPLADIEETKLSGLSLMPANLGEVLKPAETHDLLAYLLTLTSKKESQEKSPSNGRD